MSTTVTPPPEALREQGVTHWSARRLAAWLARTRKIKASHDSITRLWRRFCLQPHRTEGFKNAVVVSVDEKSQCQAVERSQLILPMRPGIPEQQAHDYARYGTTSMSPVVGMVDTRRSFS